MAERAETDSTRNMRWYLPEIKCRQFG